VELRDGRRRARRPGGRLGYAQDAGSGQLLWKRDTQGAVVSTPAVAGDRVVVGNRAYDVLALDARTGDVAWRERPESLREGWS
jgi:outer membrane protein assembly factor BamB